MNRQSMSPNSRPASAPAAMLAKSVVCVALVAGIAWIGANGAGDEALVAPSTAGVAVRGDRAAAHRQQVFDERRARFEMRVPTQLAVDANLEYPAP